MFSKTPLYINEDGLLVIPDHVYNAIHFIDGIICTENHVIYPSCIDVIFFYCDLSLVVGYDYLIDFKRKTI